MTQQEAEQLRDRVQGRVKPQITDKQRREGKAAKARPKRETLLSSIMPRSGTMQRLYEQRAIGTTFIGVDPALRAGGFWVCIICRVDNTATFKSCKHLGDFVRILQDADPIAVTVENSNLQKAMFDKKGGIGIAISVGKNMGVSQSAADIADQYSVVPSGISPKQKGAKVTNEAIFQGIAKANNLTLTNYKAGDGIGQDQRDAMMLALIAEQEYKLLIKSKK